MSTRNKKNLEQNTNNTKEYMSHNKKFVWGLDSGSAREKVFLRYKVRSFFHESYFSIKQLRSSGLMVFSLIKTCFPMPLGKLNVQVLRDKLAESPRLQMTKTTVLCCSTCTKLCQCTVRFNQNCKLLKKTHKFQSEKYKWTCLKPVHINQLESLNGFAADHQINWENYFVLFIFVGWVLFLLFVVLIVFSCGFAHVSSCVFVRSFFFLEPKRGRSIWL